MLGVAFVFGVEFSCDVWRRWYPPFQVPIAFEISFLRAKIHMDRFHLLLLSAFAVRGCRSHPYLGTYSCSSTRVGARLLNPPVCFLLSFLESGFLINIICIFRQLFTYSSLFFIRHSSLQKKQNLLPQLKEHLKSSKIVKFCGEIL